MRLKNAAIPILLVAIVLIIILPIKESVLDFLLVINISLSLVILLSSIYSTNILQMSVFPSVLLFTTVYRLSLNITSTKLILKDGHAGKVIEKFGEYVAGNNIVVGFVIYFVIMIAQFLVITKGAERVSEVAARFTLDAMPGKQMAIDADLNTGLIDETEARRRRKEIQREADFYGSMDGASKFVKNDAIFGIIATFLNVIGGLIIGMVFRGEGLQEALQTYTILTIGDGLVSQIPALMISTSTGIIVTRAASEDDLSTEVISQLFTNPKVMFITAGVCVILSFPLATVPFLLFALLFAILGFSLLKKEKKAIVQEEAAVQESEVEEIRKPENVVSLLQVDPIELEFGYGIIPMADVTQGGDLTDRVVMIRRQLALEMGMIVPVIRLRDNLQLNPNEYVIKIKGVEVARGEVVFDHYLAMNPGTAEEELQGIKTTEPAFNLPAIWITESERDRAEMLGYTVVDPPRVVSTHLTEVIRRHAHELMGRQEVQTIIDNLKENYPVIVDELIPKQMSIGEIQKVIANLLKEGISIRDMVTILETIADYAPVTHDADLLTEYVRQALGRAISKRFIEGNSVRVVTLDPKLEQTIMDSVQKTESGSFINMEPGIINKIIGNLLKQVQKLVQIGQQPIILSSPVVRLYFKRLIEQTAPDIIVLSYNEIDPDIEVQSVGMVSI